MAERVERIVALAREIAPLVGADPDKAAEAARLAKADLTSRDGRRVPRTAGPDGRLLRPRRRPGPRDRRRHPRPLQAARPGRRRPDRAGLSVAVALADKLDTLVGFFAIDEKPTGSKDPFALRRAALGVIRTLLDGGLRVPLNEIAFQAALALENSRAGPEQRLSVDQLAATPELAPEAIEMLKALASQGQAPDFRLSQAKVEAVEGYVDDLLAFFADRLKVTLKDQGKRHDLVDAVFALGDDDLVRIVARVEALDGFLKTDDGKNLLAGYKRASNILKAEEKKGWKAEGDRVLLDDASAPEVQLHDALRLVEPALASALAAEDFTAAMQELAGLRGPVDAFLDGVFVNSEVAAERDNRLKTLAAVRDAMGQVADFSLIGG
jgi:glycyl-tRNA synthetase beta chain